MQKLSKTKIRNLNKTQLISHAIEAQEYASAMEAQKQSAEEKMAKISAAIFEFFATGDVLPEKINFWSVVRRLPKLITLIVTIVKIIKNEA